MHLLRERMTIPCHHSLSLICHRQLTVEVDDVPVCSNVRKKEAAALEWFHKSAEEGNADAHSILCVSYGDGWPRTRQSRV